ncbi:MAG: DUF2905 domain-containing protein [Fidelibacterota bacterium]|jgi:hypothetical protein
MLEPFQSLAKIFIIIGGVLIVVGFLIGFAGKIPWMEKLGHLPGDILIKRENFTFYFPVTTSILLSLIVTFIFYIIKRL